MRFREPLLGGSSAMPGASLQRACRLLVAVCALHLGITLVYYLAGSDLSRLPQLVGVRTPLQGGPTVAATPPPLSWGVSSELRPGSHSSPRPASNLTSAPVLPTSAPALPACPEESPLLGKVAGLELPGCPRQGPLDTRPVPLARQPASPFRTRAPNPKQVLG